MSSSSGANDSISSEAAVAMAAVMGLRQQHLNAAVANQHHSESDLSNFNLRSGKNFYSNFIRNFSDDFRNNNKKIYIALYNNK